MNKKREEVKIPEVKWPPRGYIGKLYGVDIFEVSLYARQKPKWFPSNWLWYALVDLFTIRQMDRQLSLDSK